MLTIQTFKRPSGKNHSQLREWLWAKKAWNEHEEKKTEV
jgi:hypothetical protein